MLKVTCSGPGVNRTRNLLVTSPILYQLDHCTQAGYALSKLSIAMDRIKYKRLGPQYIAYMHEMKTKHPATWQELEDGNISATKSEIPFVSIGADHACEHLNRMMKVHSGLVGISNNPNAQQRFFFLASPEMSCLSTEFKG